MKKILFLSTFVIFSQQYKCWAEIRNYILDKIEITDGTGNIKTTPIPNTANEKPMTLNLILAGLGTNRVTAQCSIYSLAIETQISPLDKNNGTGSDGNREWYYVSHSMGITIIELCGKVVKLHNLGAVPYTYIGEYKQ